MSVLALAVGPLVYQVARIARSMLAALDGLVFVAIGGLVLLLIIPTSIALGGWVAILGALVGLLASSFVEHRLHGFARRTHLVALLLGLTAIVLHAFVDGLALAGQAPGHQMLPVAVLLHRLPVGLTIWFLLRPVYGLGAALDVLGVVGAATAVGFFTSEAVAGFMENPGWGVFEDWS